MTVSSYIIRNYQPFDFAPCTRLHAEAERQEGSQRLLGLDFAERLRRPGYDPWQDVLVAETDREIVACLEMTLEKAIGRIVLNCRVKSGYRRSGISTGFLQRAEQRARQLGIKRLHACIGEADEEVKTVLQRLGFCRVRRFLEMDMNLGNFSGGIASTCQQMRQGEEEKLTYLQNRSFTGTWGYNPNTLEQITYHSNAGESSPEDTILCYAGDEPAAYCWTRVLPNKLGMGRSGRILMIGVFPEYRGRGIGRVVLEAGLAHLKRKGIQEVALTVDSENRVALSLYRAVGFEIEAGSLWYERLLD
ncbi:GNAT family N-acetyltransferase [Chloroflexota bacterium]